MFFAFLPISFCLITTFMSPLTVLDASDFHILTFFLNLDSFSLSNSQNILFLLATATDIFFPPDFTWSGYSPECAQQ